MRQGRRNTSSGIQSTKHLGTPTWVGTCILAPVRERSRTTQLTGLPPVNSIRAAFETRWRGVVRGLAMYKQLGFSVLLNNNHVSLTSDEPGDRGFSGCNLEMRTFPVSFAAHNGLVAGSSAAGPTSI